jgi:hypothetical protein
MKISPKSIASITPTTIPAIIPAFDFGSSVVTCSEVFRVELLAEGFVETDVVGRVTFGVVKGVVTSVVGAGVVGVVVLTVVVAGVVGVVVLTVVGAGVVGVVVLTVVGVGVVGVVVLTVVVGDAGVVVGVVTGVTTTAKGST